MKQHHKGDVVVVTGAGTGVARACARAFARSGARVHVVDGHLDRAEAVREECRVLGAEATSHILDVGDARVMEELAEDIVLREGRVDVLLNGPGSIVAGPIEVLSLADWRRAMETNLWATIHGIHAFIGRMIAQAPRDREGDRASRRGAVINIASMLGLAGLPYSAPHAAASAAIIGLGEALAAELDPRGIQVLTVCPPAVKRRFFDDDRVTLPPSWEARLDNFYRAWAISPDPVARQILRALRRDDESLVVARLGPAALWLAKRIAGQRYASWTRRIFAFATDGTHDDGQPKR